MVDRYSPVPYQKTNQQRGRRQAKRSSRQRPRDGRQTTTKNETEGYDTETTTGGSTSRGEYETEESSISGSYSSTIGLTTSRSSETTGTSAPTPTSSTMLNEFLDDLENMTSMPTHDEEDEEEYGEYEDSYENLEKGKKKKEHYDTDQQPQRRRQQISLKVDVGRNATTVSDQPSLVLSPNEELALLATRVKPNSPDHTPDEGLKSLNPPNLMMGGKEEVAAATPSPTYFDFSPDKTPPFLNAKSPDRSDGGGRFNNNDKSSVERNKNFSTETHYVNNHDAHRHVDFSSLARTINSQAENDSFINSRDMLIRLRNDDRQNNNIQEESPISAGADCTNYFSGSSTPGGGNCYDGDDDESPVARPAAKQDKTTKQRQHQLTKHAPQPSSLLSPGGGRAYDGDDDESEPAQQQQQRSRHQTLRKPRQVAQGRRSGSGGPSTQEEPSHYMLSSGSAEAPAPVSHTSTITKIDRTDHKVQSLSSKEGLVDRPGAMSISSEPHHKDLAQRQIKALSEARRIISLPPTDEEPPEFCQRDSPGGRTVSDSSTRDRGVGGSSSKQIFSRPDLYDGPAGQKTRALTQARRRVSEPVTVEEPGVLTSRHETKPLADQDSTPQRKQGQSIERNDFTNESDFKTSVEARHLGDCVVVATSVNETAACQSRTVSASDTPYDPATQHVRRSKATARLSKQPSDGLIQCEDPVRGEPENSADPPALNQTLQIPRPLPPVHHKFSNSGTRPPSTGIESERKARGNNDSGANLRIVATSDVSPAARGSPSDPYFVSRWKSRLTPEVPQQQCQPPNAGVDTISNPLSLIDTTERVPIGDVKYETTSGILESNPTFLVGKNVGKLKGTTAASDSLNRGDDRNVSAGSGDSGTGPEYHARQEHTGQEYQVESYPNDEKKVDDFPKAKDNDRFKRRINHGNKNNEDSKGIGPEKHVGKSDEGWGRNTETCNAPAAASDPKEANEGAHGPEITFEDRPTSSKEAWHQKNTGEHQVKIEAEMPVRVAVCTTPRNYHGDTKTAKDDPDPMFENVHEQSKVTVGVRNCASYLSSTSGDDSENSSGSEDMREGYNGAFPVSLDQPLANKENIGRSVVHSSVGSEPVVDTDIHAGESGMVNAPSDKESSSAGSSPDHVEQSKRSSVAMRNDLANCTEDDESKSSSRSYSYPSHQAKAAEPSICASKSDDGILYSSGEGGIACSEPRVETIPKNASMEDWSFNNEGLSKNSKTIGATREGHGKCTQNFGSHQWEEPKEDGRNKRMPASYISMKSEFTEKPGIAKNDRRLGSDTNVYPKPWQTNRFGDKRNSKHGDSTEKPGVTEDDCRLGNDTNTYPKPGQTKKLEDRKDSKRANSSEVPGVQKNNSDPVNDTDTNLYSNPWQAKKLEGRTDSKHDESFDAPSYGSTRFMRSLASDLTDDSEDVNSQNEKSKFVESREKVPDVKPAKKRDFVVSGERIARTKQGQVRKNNLDLGRRSQPQADMRATSIMMKSSESDLTSESEDLDLQQSEDLEVEYVQLDRCKRGECLFQKPSAGAAVIPGISTSSSDGVGVFCSEDDDGRMGVLGDLRHPRHSDVMPVDEGATYSVEHDEARWGVTRVRFDPSHAKDIDDGPELMQDEEPAEPRGRKTTRTVRAIGSPTTAGEIIDTQHDKYSSLSGKKGDAKSGGMDKRSRARASRKPGAVAVKPRVGTTNAGPEYITEYDDILVGPFRRTKEPEDGPELMLGESSQRSGRRSIRQILEDSDLGTTLAAGDNKKKQDGLDCTDNETEREEPHQHKSARVSQPGAEPIKGGEQKSFQKFDHLTKGRRTRPESTQMAGANDKSVDERFASAKGRIPEDESARASQPGAEPIKGEEQKTFQKFGNLIEGRRTRLESTQIAGANDSSIDERSRSAKGCVPDDLKVVESTSSEDKYLPSALNINPPPPPVGGSAASTFSWSSFLSSEDSSRGVQLRSADSEEGSGVEARHVESGSQDVTSNPSGSGIQTMEPETPELPYQEDELERQSVTRAISAHLVTTEPVDVEAARTKVREQAEKEAIAQFENNAITVEAEKIEVENGFNWRLYGCLSCLLVVAVVIIASVLATREKPINSTLNDICSRAHGPLDTVQGVVNGILEERAGQDSIGCQVTSDADSGYGLWYFVKAETASRLIVSTCSGSDDSSDSDTQVLVFGGGSCDNLQCIGGSDELCGSHGSVGWLAEKGSTYYILVRGYRKSNTGPFSLSIDTLDSNGECNDAATVVVTESPVIGSTRNLTTATSLFNCGSTTAVAPGAWHRLIGDGGVVCASAVSDQELPVFPLQLSILEDDDDDCEDSSCVGGVTGSSEIAWLAKDGLSYYIIVHGQETHATGDFILNLSKAAANAVCDSALAIFPDGSIASGSLSQACRGDLSMECASSVLDAPGVWYSIDASMLPAGSMLRATLSGAVCEKQGVITSQITVFEGDSCSDLRCPIVIHGGCQRLVETSVQWFTNVGETYYLYVQSSESNMFDLIVEEISPDVPDVCENATRLSATGDNILGSTIPASPDILDGCSTSTTPGVFYEVIGTGADMFASTCNPGTNFATSITILAGTCESFECLDSITESCDGGLRSTTYWPTVRGKSYLVYLHGNDRSEPNTGIFNLTIGESLLNDFCPGALDLEIPSITVGSTLYATKDNVDVCGNDKAAAPGVWFVTHGNGNSLTASLCADFTDYDTQIYVYKGSSCDALQCIASNDDSCGTRSKVTWVSAVNERYYIFVSGFDNAVGNFEMAITEDSS